MNSLDTQYINLLKDILDNGIKKTDRTGTGTISVFGRTIRHKMSDGFPLLTTKKMYFKGVVAELLWFLRGDTNVKFLHDNKCHIWDGDLYKNYKTLFESRAKVSGEILLNKEQFVEKLKTDSTFSKKYGNLGPIYPKQWRNWSHFEEIKILNLNAGNDQIIKKYEEKNIDQIYNLIRNISDNPDSRRLMVNAWNLNDLDRMILPPCHYGFQIYTRELSLEERVRHYETTLGRLHFIPPTIDMLDKENIPTRAMSLMWNQRSVDTFLGLPFNIASYGLLLLILSEIYQMIPEEIIGNLGDTHLYLNHIDQVKEQILREPFQLPIINIKTEEWNWLTSDDSNLDRFISSIKVSDFEIINYTSHPKIEGVLSN